LTDYQPPTGSSLGVEIPLVRFTVTTVKGTAYVLDVNPEALDDPGLDAVAYVGRQLIDLYRRAQKEDTV
jgi:hypothetical protein